MSKSVKHESIVENFEPQQYFNKLKAEILTISEQELNKLLLTVETTMMRANEVGQHTLLSKLIFAREHIKREIVAQSLGFNRFVYKDAISNFMDIIKPNNAVKIIELDRFPRIIPEENMALIKKAQEFSLFDSYCVVFTDLSGEKLETPEEIAMRDRNRDPIVFGYYSKEKTSLRSDRFYLITDWEDEYCDLTFDKMIKSLSENEYGTVDMTDQNEIQKIIHDADKIEKNKKTQNDEVMHVSVSPQIEIKPLKKFDALSSKIKTWFNK